MSRKTVLHLYRLIAAFCAFVYSWWQVNYTDCFTYFKGTAHLNERTKAFVRSFCSCVSALSWFTVSLAGLKGLTGESLFYQSQCQQAQIISSAGHNHTASRGCKLGPWVFLRRKTSGLLTCSDLFIVRIVPGFTFSSSIDWEVPLWSATSGSALLCESLRMFLLVWFKSITVKNMGGSNLH